MGSVEVGAGKPVAVRMGGEMVGGFAMLNTSRTVCDLGVSGAIGSWLEFCVDMRSSQPRWL
jgi:hypothetical protein